jgi:hypothetical protein
LAMAEIMGVSLRISAGSSTRNNGFIVNNVRAAAFQWSGRYGSSLYTRMGLTHVNIE